MNAPCARIASTIPTAAASPAAGAGAIAQPAAPAHPNWAETLIARREAARRFLAANALTPFLLNRASGMPPNQWHVPGYGGGFLDHDLIGLAERLGMGGHG